jgi:hypothetical protein
MSLNVVFCAPVEIVFSRQRIVSRRGFRLPQFDELFRMDVGQRLEQRGVNGGENRRVRADAEGEGKHGDGGEAGGFAQHAQSVAQILYEVLNPVYFARVAAFLFGLLGPAQVESRAAPRLFLRHPFCDVFLGFSFQVVAQLVVQFLVCLRPAKQRPQPQWNRVQPMLRWHLPGLLTRTSKRPSDRRAWRGVRVPKRRRAPHL